MMKQQRRKENHQSKGNHKKITKDKKYSNKQTNNPINPINSVKKSSGGNEQLPTIQNMLEIKAEDRSARTSDYFKKVKPFLGTYLPKKQGSRVVQLMFKWGDAQIKQSIFKAIIQNWKDLIKSKYALHTISKVSTEFQFPRLVQDAIILQNNKEGSMVLQNFINKHPGSPKSFAIVNKFEAIQKQSAQKGFESQEALHNLAMKSIQKQYYNNKVSKLILKLALPTMIENQRQKVIEFLSEKALDLLTDDEGVKLFISLYNYFDSKQKKGIVIKQLKGKVMQVMQRSKISYVALIKIITQTDDTVMIGNKTVQQLLQNIAEISNENNKLYNVLISILSPRNNNFNCLGKLEKDVTFTTCKKAEEVRKKQIREFIYPALADHLTNSENIDATCKSANQSRLALGLIKSMQTDGSEQLKDFATKITKFFIQNLQALRQKNSKKIDIENSLIADNFGSKLIKNVLLLQQTYMDKYCDKLSEMLKSNLEKVLHSNASFVLTVLIQKGRNELLDQIKRSKIDVSKARASDFYLSRIKNKSK